MDTRNTEKTKSTLKQGMKNQLYHSGIFQHKQKYMHVNIQHPVVSTARILVTPTCQLEHTLRITFRPQNSSNHRKTYTVKPGQNALEGTGPRERYRRENIRGKSFSGITKSDIISIATLNDNARTKRSKKIIGKNAL